mgnify:FL=1
MTNQTVEVQALTDEQLLTATGGRVVNPVGNSRPAARRVLLRDAAVTNLQFLGPPEFAGV